MNHPYMVWLLKALEVLFFTGLGGCVLVVIISWFSIGIASFSKDKPGDD